MIFKLPLPPSQNQLLRMHWARRMKIKKEYVWLIKSIASRGGWEKPNKKKLNVTITRHSCGVEPDTDNLYGGCKLVLDALKTAGQIIDDSPKHIKLKAKWQRVKTRKEQKVTVEVS